jgi:hypothetical protein
MKYHIEHSVTFKQNSKDEVPNNSAQNSVLKKFIEKVKDLHNPLISGYTKKLVSSSIQIIIQTPQGYKIESGSGIEILAQDTVLHNIIDVLHKEGINDFIDVYNIRTGICTGEELDVTISLKFIEDVLGQVKEMQ